MKLCKKCQAEAEYRVQYTMYLCKDCMDNGLDLTKISILDLIEHKDYWETNYGA